MFDFIPLEYYSQIYLNVCLFFVLLTFVQGTLTILDDSRNIIFFSVLGYSLLFLIIFYIGLRPISQKYFGDMLPYAKYFEAYANGGLVLTTKDVFFHYFMKFTSNFLTVNQFFLLCSALYVFPMYLVSKRHFKEYWFYAFLVFIVSFQFWPYGVNGIRNGVATSFFLMGIAYYDRKFVMFLFFLLATMFHKSLILPIMAYCICFIYNGPKFYLYVWLACIPFSIALGSTFESLLVATGLGTDRLETYLSGDLAENAGFRYDFLLYSASAAFTGWYFIFVKNFNDKIYHKIYNTYLITNAFWILVIRASFSNRFAYLSWFMISLVIIYPFLKVRYFERQHSVIVWVVFANFFFTYFMSFIYYALIK